MSASDDQAARDASSTREARGRISSLDGLRGIAALAVLGFHASALSPRIADYLLNGAAAPTLWSVEWWIVASPFRLLTAGEEAVFVFFVLSGFVLTLPVLQARFFDWSAFATSRVLRLFVPTAASLVLAYLAIRLIPRSPDVTLSVWLADPYNPTSVSLRRLLSNVDLIFSDASVNGPVWTIRWELLFSFLLPVAVGLALFAARKWMFGFVFALVLVLIGLQSGVLAFVYLPTFFMGVLLALRFGEFQAHYERAKLHRPRRTAAVVACVVVGTLALLSALVLLKPFVDASGALAVSARLASICGATLLVATVAITAPAWLSSRLLAWLGKISFSLYLVHQPILATVGYTLGREHWFAGALLGVVLSFVVAVAFWVFVERPSHKFARWAGQAQSRLLRSWSGASAKVPDARYELSRPSID